MGERIVPDAAPAALVGAPAVNVAVAADPVADPALPANPAPPATPLTRLTDQQIADQLAAINAEMGLLKGRLEEVATAIRPLLAAVTAANLDAGAAGTARDAAQKKLDDIGEDKTKGKDSQEYKDQLVVVAVARKAADDAADKAKVLQGLLDPLSAREKVLADSIKRLDGERKSLEAEQQRRKDAPPKAPDAAAEVDFNAVAV